MFALVVTLSGSGCNGLVYNDDKEVFYTTDNGTRANKIYQISKRSNDQEMKVLELQAPATYHDLHFTTFSRNTQTLWVADYLGYSLHEITLDGCHLRTWGQKNQFEEKNGTPQQTRIKYPTRIVFDENGNAYILDYIVSTIRKIDKDGISSVWRDFEDFVRVDYESQIAYCQINECIYVTTSAKGLLKVTEKEATQILDGYPGMSALAVNKKGQVYFATNDTIYKFNPKSTTIEVVLSPQTKDTKGSFFLVSQNIKDLCLDAKGTLYCMDRRHIYRISKKSDWNRLIRPVSFPWKVGRLLWLAKFKNEPDYCPLASLPTDMLKELTNILVECWEPDS